MNNKSLNSIIAPLGDFFIILGFSEAQADSALLDIVGLAFGNFTFLLLKEVPDDKIESFFSIIDDNKKTINDRLEEVLEKAIEFCDEGRVNDLLAKSFQETVDFYMAGMRDKLYEEQKRIASNFSEESLNGEANETGDGQNA